MSVKNGMRHEACGTRYTLIDFFSKYVFSLDAMLIRTFIEGIYWLFVLFLLAQN